MLLVAVEIVISIVVRKVATFIIQEVMPMVKTICRKIIERFLTVGALHMPIRNMYSVRLLKNILSLKLWDSVGYFKLISNIVYGVVCITSRPIIRINTNIINRHTTCPHIVAIFTLIQINGVRYFILL